MSNWKERLDTLAAKAQAFAAKFQPESTTHTLLLVMCFLLACLVLHQGADKNAEV